VGWVHWSSTHRSIISVVVVYAGKMTPNNSFPFLQRMLLTLETPNYFPSGSILALLTDHHILQVSRIRANICMVCSGLPHSCMLSRMFNAYAETGLFVLYVVYVHGALNLNLPTTTIVAQPFLMFC
jgi:hypothetical protein